MELTRKQAIVEHRKMWRWIAIQTLKQNRCVLKNEYFKENNIQIVDSWCFCCAYDNQFKNEKCTNCPIEWHSDDDLFMCMDKYEKNDYYGIFSLWLGATKYGNVRKAALLAYKISKLPERKTNV